MTTASSLVFLLRGPDSDLPNYHIDPLSSPDVLRNPYNQTVVGNQFDFKNVITISIPELNQYSLGEILSSPGALPGNGQPLPEGTLIQASGSAEISIVTASGGRRPFQTLAMFNGLGYLACNVVAVSSSAYNAYPAGTPVDGTFGTVSETISTPNAPSGAATGFTGTSYGFYGTGAVSSLEHPIQYLYSFGDGSQQGWVAAGSAGTHTWTAPGTYQVTVQARCAIDNTIVSLVSTPLTVTITNPPLAETISLPNPPNGPQTAVNEAGVTYSYTGGGL